jgi:site-specific DNA-cytosine methylase
VDTTKELTHISLCAGYGGIDIGLKRAIGNVRTIAFSEIEAYATANLVAKMEKGWLDTAPIWTNLKTFPWKDFYGKVDILSGGFPCQPFSGAGRKSADDDPRHLWPFIVKGIKQLGRPPIVFFENVEGIISSEIKSDGWSDPIGTPVLLHVLRELEKMGYQATAGVFSAIEVSAPHQRKRVFILAVSNELQQSGRDIVSNFINREELGYSEHDGSLDFEVNRNLDQTSYDSAKGEDSSKQSERTGGLELTRGLSAIERYYSREYKTAYPAFRGQEQYEWEAPRTVKKRDSKLGNSISKRELLSAERKYASEPLPKCSPSRLPESKMDGTADGITSGVGTSELFSSYDNRADELRLLGNGVVPDSAERAFTELWKELAHPCD